MQEHNKMKDKIAMSVLQLSQSKHIPELTVSDVTEAAGISRKTFYNHFNNITQVVEYLPDMVNTMLNLDELFKIKGKKEFITACVTSLPDALYENRDYLRILLNTDLTGAWKRYLVKTYGALVRDNIFADYESETYPKNIAYQVFTQMIVSLVEAWITQPMPQSPDQFRQMIITTLQKAPLKWK
ncbi:TetR/AcrR family transcriptional regulator [Fructilactobacillus sp. Tb1]|uniref:TetR/AcrR family transcriptional regulator n=1 Tax=Fructilactobacillus sp. Tb1 TaxID=3422304 RepID=UPI003D274CAB